jgi:uncharacterized protein YegP (UPF0339 family)
MTGATRLTQAVDATRKARAAENAQPASMKFVIFEDNGGAYHWTIIAASGETLVRSATFASYEDAKQAACVVHAGAGSASFERLAGGTPPVDLAAPVDLATRRETRAARGDPDAERWLDEGGSFSSEAVRRWPPRR